MAANQKPTPAQISKLKQLERAAGGYRPSSAAEARALVQLRHRGWAWNDAGEWDITNEGREVVAAAKRGDQRSVSVPGVVKPIRCGSIERARLIAASPDLLAELDCRVGDLVMLRRAIQAGDPKTELLFRVDEMLRESRAALAKATGG